MRKSLWLALCFAASWLGCCAPAAAQTSLTFRMLSEHRGEIHVEFHSADRKNYRWPGNGKVFTLFHEDEASRFKINCLGGEKICYGAWLADRPNITWGQGKNQESGCNSCCFTCNGGETRVITLKR